MSERIELDVAGKKTLAEVTHATGAVRGGVVVVQEWWGVTDHMRDVSARFAKEGYEVVTPDLYNGRTTKDPQEAMKLLGEMDWPTAIGSVLAAAAHLRKTTGKKVAAAGYCLGGSIVLMAAAQDPELAAAVPFYGLPTDPSKFDWSKMTAKVQGHFGGKDSHIPVEKVQAFEKQVQEAGGSIKMNVYENADHAFFNDTRTEVYNPEAAALAWKRTLEFLHANVG